MIKSRSSLLIRRIKVWLQLLHASVTTFSFASFDFLFSVVTRPLAWHGGKFFFLPRPSAKCQLWPSVVHLTCAIYWFVPSLKLPKVIHSAILLVLSVAIRDTAVSLALTSMTVEPPTRSAPRVRHGRSNNTSLANQTILLIFKIECKKCKKNNTLEKPNVASANGSLNTGKLQIILITPALQQQYLRISTCLSTPLRTCYLSF